MHLISRHTLLVMAALTFAACGPKNSSTPANSDNSIVDYNDGEERLPDDATEEVANEDVNQQDDTLASTFKTPSYSSSQKSSILAKYNHLDPNKMVDTGLLAKAILYYHANLASIPRKSVLTVLDYSLSSKNNRMFIINMSTGAVVASHMAHGSGSDRNHDGFAESFSNVSGSNASSIGPYLAAETYSGKYGLSLRIDGLASTNSRARARAVVVHGSYYVQDRSVIQGRSWGCPAVPMGTRTKIINAIKGGSLIYAGLSKSLSSTP